MVSVCNNSTDERFMFQVVEDTVDILTNFGYTFEPRGRIRVKGKGELMTYFLTGKSLVKERNFDETIVHPFSINTFIQ